MKIFRILWLLLAFCAPLLAQNYQYQAPYDPYNSAPKPQPNAYAPGPGAPVGDEYSQLLSYGFLEARYAYNDFKNNPEISNTNGIDLGLNVQLFKPFYLHFGLDWISGSSDVLGSYNMTGLSGGVGAYLPICSRFHIFGEVGVRYDTSSGVLDSFNNDNFQVYLRPGVRFAATDRVELDASVLFATSSDLDNRVFQVDGYYNMFGNLDLNLGIDFGSDTNSYRGGLRLRW